MEEEMDVGVDESGHEGAVAEIDDGGSGGMGDAGPARQCRSPRREFRGSDEGAVVDIGRWAAWRTVTCARAGR